VASGDLPLSYVWRKDGAPLQAATNATLELTNLKASDGGDYDVIVFNPVGSATSSVARLFVVVPLEVLQQPETQEVDPGQSATFTVQAVGTGTIRYQWYFEGQPISGATSDTLHIADAQVANSGAYWVVLSDDVSVITSDIAYLAVRVPPVIVEHPQHQTLPLGATLTLTVRAEGARPMGYRWRRTGRTVSFKIDDPVYSVTNVQMQDAGDYTVVVTNVARRIGILSHHAFVTIVDPPKDQTAQIGDDITFTVAATGLRTITYQWQHDGVTLASGTNTTLTVQNVQPEDVGTYTVWVTNRVGFAVPFSATLRLAGPPRLSNPVLQPGVGFEMRLEGNPGQTYAIETSSDLVHWTKLKSVVYTNGLMPVVDAEALSSDLDQRFYRAREE